MYFLLLLLHTICTNLTSMEIYMSCTSWDFVQDATCTKILYKLQLVQTACTSCNLYRWACTSCNMYRFYPCTCCNLYNLDILSFFLLFLSDILISCDFWYEKCMSFVYINRFVVQVTTCTKSQLVHNIYIHMYIVTSNIFQLLLMYRYTCLFLYHTT